MNSLIKDFVEQQVCKSIAPQFRKKFLEIAQLCDSIGHEALSMNANELMMEIVSRALPLQVTIQDIQNFLDNDLIANYFAKLLIKTKAIDFRKMIASIDKNQLDQKGVKALDMLQKFLNDTVEQEGVVYISYIGPIRYCNDDTLAFVQNFIEEDNDG